MKFVHGYGHALEHMDNEDACDVYAYAYDVWMSENYLYVIYALMQWFYKWNAMMYEMQLICNAIMKWMNV